MRATQEFGRYAPPPRCPRTSLVADITEQRQQPATYCFYQKPLYSQRKCTSAVSSSRAAIQKSSSDSIIVPGGFSLKKRLQATKYDTPACCTTAVLKTIKYKYNKKSKNQQPKKTTKQPKKKTKKKQRRHDYGRENNVRPSKREIPGSPHLRPL